MNYLCKCIFLLLVQKLEILLYFLLSLLALIGCVSAVFAFSEYVLFFPTNLSLTREKWDCFSA